MAKQTTRRVWNINFVGNLPKYLMLSGIILVAGIVANLIFGTVLSIDFSGGTQIDYTYVGEINATQLENDIEASTGLNVTVVTGKQFTSAGDTAEQGETKKISVTLVEKGAVSLEAQSKIESVLAEKYAENQAHLLQASSVDASVGAEFLGKSVYAVGLASVLVILYIGIRFRKIGGLSAGVTAMIALIHDIFVAYFICIFFRLPIDDNFMAVVLTILGYSLNDTIIIYDRIRENERLYGKSKPIGELVNLSVNQTLGRTLVTAFATFIAITTVLVVALIFGLDSIMSFALPMSIGVISGSYSTICLASPIWVKWQEYKERKGPKSKDSKSGGKTKSRKAVIN